MGRQIAIHMLPDDVRAFVDFIRKQAPVIVTLRDADSPKIEPVPDPASETRIMTLWNTALLSSFERTHVVVIPGKHEYYLAEDTLPILEFVPSRRCEWNGRRALVEGRLYTGFDADKGKEFEKWYQSIFGWLKTHFRKNPGPLGPSCVGPAAFQFYLDGGILVPMPPETMPVNDTWLAFVQTQDDFRESYKSLA